MEQQRVCNKCFRTKSYLKPKSPKNYNKDTITTTRSIPKPVVRVGGEIVGNVTEAVVERIVDSILN